VSLNVLKQLLRLTTKYNSAKGEDRTFLEVTESDQTEYDQTSHYGILESDKALFGMW
jgi:hypothetical protein